MNALVIGATGMLGHALCRELSRGMTVFGTVRDDVSTAARFGILPPERIIAGVEADRTGSIDAALERAAPDVVVNCVGIVKQSPEARDPVRSIVVNSLFPHLVANACGVHGIRMIHISTDCVFSGAVGGYRESDLPDPPDLYGRSKLLGEVDHAGALTLRTSMIGRELRGAVGLVEWFLSQAGGAVRGFTRAVFSGLTTLALSRVIADVVLRHPSLCGLYHVAATPVSKHDLLCMLNEAFGARVQIAPDDSFICDRSLDGARFLSATGSLIPSWNQMIEELASVSAHYTELRSSHATPG